MKKSLKDYFIPHEGNDFKPHSLQKAAVVGMTFMVLLSFALTNLQSILWLNSDWLVSTILPAVIVELTNEERSDGALDSLQRSVVLDAAAKMKAEHMARNEYFAHNSPDGITPWYWFGQAGYNFLHAGENLAIHFTDSGDVVEAWMDSPTHRANIMSGNYVQIGVGTAEGEYEGFKTVYVVQLFGAPAVSVPVVAGQSTTSGNDADQDEADFVDDTLAASEAVPENNETTVVLAEQAQIFETQEFIPAEPELVAVEEVVVTETASKTVEVEDIVVTDTGVALFSDFVSTSTAGVPASIEPDTEAVKPPSTIGGRLLTGPHLVLQILYTITAAFVFAALMLAIFIEIRRQQPVQVAYALLLLLMMYGLFELHTFLSGGALIV